MWYEAQSELVSLPSYRGRTGAQERLPSRGRYEHVALAKVSGVVPTQRHGAGRCDGAAARERDAGRRAGGESREACGAGEGLIWMQSL